MRSKVARSLGVLYVLGAAYYGPTSAFGLLRGNADIRLAAPLVVSSVWLAVCGLGLAGERSWGWWGAVAFFLVCVGGHGNRLFAVAMVDAAHVTPILWAAAHIALLAWVRSGAASHVHLAGAPAA